MKSLLFIVMMVFVSPAFAQRINLDSARIYLSQDNYKKALPFANEAVKNIKTRDDPEAWFLRGMAYLQLAQDEAAKSPNAITEAYGSFLKTLTLKPDYGSEINNPLYSVAIVKFNRGSALYSEKSFDRSYNEFAEVAAIYKMGGGKRFLDNAEFKAVQVDARKNAAFAANSAGRGSVASALLEDLVKNESKDDSDVYQALIEIYEAGKFIPEELNVIKAARKQFPENESFRLAEINYYLGNGPREELRPKLEEAVRRDSGNADLLFNLANVYLEAAFPANAEGKLVALPANFAETFAKAEHSYDRALKLSSGDANRNYNFALLYYNYARWYNQQMTDNPNADNKTLSDLKAKRNEQFSKAIPYFEKSYSIIDARTGAITDADKATCHNLATVLREIYTQNGDAANKARMDKAAEKWK